MATVAPMNPGYALPLFAGFFVSLWLCVGFIVSRMGWSTFAQRYPSFSRPLGESFNCQAAWFRSPFASYKNVVRVVFADSGVYVYVFVLFRAFHPAFLIPWGKVAGVRKKKMLWMEFDVLEIRDGSDEMNIRLSNKALLEYQRLKKA
jgi:hypothetical protein